MAWRSRFAPTQRNKERCAAVFDDPALTIFDADRASQLAALADDLEAVSPLFATLTTAADRLRIARDLRAFGWTKL